MTIMLRTLAPVIAAVVAAALAAAPAQASANPIQCREGGAARVCHKQGHSSLRSTPAVRAPAQGLFGSAWLPGYGRGHMPPLLALD